MKISRYFLLSGLLTISLLAVRVSAAPMGTFAGAVMDSTGAVVSGATILIQHWTPEENTAHHMNPSVDPMIRTDSRGRFSIQLPPGLYDIFVSYPAFSPFAKKVRIEPNKVTTLNPKLRFDPLVRNVE